MIFFSVIDELVRYSRLCIEKNERNEKSSQIMGVGMKMYICTYILLSSYIYNILFDSIQYYVGFGCVCKVENSRKVCFVNCIVVIFEIFFGCRFFFSSRFYF